MRRELGTRRDGGTLCSCVRPRQGQGRYRSDSEPRLWARSLSPGSCLDACAWARGGATRNPRPTYLYPTPFPVYFLHLSRLAPDIMAAASVYSGAGFDFTNEVRYALLH